MNKNAEIASIWLLEFHYYSGNANIRFCQIFPKIAWLHEIERIWMSRAEGGGRLSFVASLRSANKKWTKFNSNGVYNFEKILWYPLISNFIFTVQIAWTVVWDVTFEIESALCKNNLVSCLYYFGTREVQIVQGVLKYDAGPDTG